MSSLAGKGLRQGPEAPPRTTCGRCEGPLGQAVRPSFPSTPPTPASLPLTPPAGSFRGCVPCQGTWRTSLLCCSLAVRLPLGPGLPSNGALQIQQEGVRASKAHLSPKLALGKGHFPHQPFWLLVTFPSAL